MNQTVENSYTDEALRSNNTQEVSVNLLQIRHALRHDPEFFIQFFMGESLSKPVPEFHRDAFYEMTHTDVDRFVQALPRGHAKTMLAKLATVYVLLFTEYRFALYVSGSHDLVVPYVNDIANFFEHPNFRAVFGPVEWLIKQDGVGIYKFRIPSLSKVCILRGLGAGQRVRGINVDNERPQIAIVDDLEDDDSVSSNEAHNKILRWFFGAFLKCLDPISNKVLASGNLLSKRSVLWKLLHSDRWRSVLYAVIRENGQPLWPEVWPLDRVREDFREYQEMGMTAKWMAEMMNFPVPEGGVLINAENIAYRQERVPEEVEYGFVTCDPAFSDKTWADDCAWGAHGWIENEGLWQTLETRNEKGVDPTRMFWELIEMASRWGFRLIGVEAHSLQKALLHHFTHLLLLNNLQEQFQFVPLSAENRSKTSRIVTWVSMLKQSEHSHPEWALTHGDFAVTNELIHYEPMRKDNIDNLLDVCAYGVQMIQYYLPDIMQKLNLTPRGSVASLAAISEV